MGVCQATHPSAERAPYVIMRRRKNKRQWDVEPAEGRKLLDGGRERGYVCRLTNRGLKEIRRMNALKRGFSVFSWVF